MAAVQAVKKEVGNDLSATRELTVSHLPGIDTEAVKQMFLAMTGTVKNNEKGPDDQ